MRDGMSSVEHLRLLVGTERGLYEFGAREQRHFDGEEIMALAPDGGAWWALAGGRAVWRSRPDGSWEQVAAIEDAVATCLAPAPAGLLVGTTGAHLLRLRDGRLERVEPFDHIEGREAWHTPWGDPPDTRSISVDATGALYVNVHVGGVVRSGDGGGSWRPTLDIDTDVHQVLAHPTRPGVVLAAAAVGLAVSEDGGDSWRVETAGLHARYLRAVAVAGDAVLVSASSGPRGRRAALYRTGLARGGRFERCRAGLPEWFATNVDTGCLAAAGGTAAFGTDEGLLLRSTDAGASWETIAKDLSPVRCVALG